MHRNLSVAIVAYEITATVLSRCYFGDHDMGTSNPPLDRTPTGAAQFQRSAPNSLPPVGEIDKWSLHAQYQCKRQGGCFGAEEANTYN